MRSATQRLAAWVLFMAGMSAAAPVLAGPVMSISTSASGGYTNLNSLTIDRDGAGGYGSFSYSHASLIGFSVMAYNSENPSTVIIPVGGTVPAVDTRTTLLTDRALNTGMINLEENPGGEASPRDPAGLRIVFNTPVVNSVGIDVVFFEVQGTFPPDPFRVKVTGGGIEKTYSNSTGDYTGKLGDSKFDVKGSGSAINTLAGLQSASLTTSPSGNLTQGIYAVGIDLSVLGVPLGESIASLDFRSADQSNPVDPVLIAGLPAVVPLPPAAWAGLALLASLGAWRLRQERLSRVS